MAARKLQTEIDRTLKKVAEGVEVFEGIFDKIQTSQNQTQKDKLESDLKTQIKKLQRLRDQIKTWITSSEIKDKQPLLDNRKLIETQMERFKAIEKEMKTKAFSKEGLSGPTRLDPKEREKQELSQWISTQVDELGRQVEHTEAEVEQIQLTKKKKDTEKEQRVADLETLNERRTWHVGRLELILRLLENGNLQTDAVQQIKEDIGYFVESNTEEDFEEDEGIYDDLNLQDEEDLFALPQDDHVSSHDSVSVADDPLPPQPVAAPSKPHAKLAEPSPAAEKSPTAAKTTKTAATRKPTLDGTAQRPTGLTSTPTRSASGPAVSSPSSGPTPRTVPAQLPPIRYAAAAAAGAASAATAASAAAATAASTPRSVPAASSAPAPVAAAVPVPPTPAAAPAPAADPSPPPPPPAAAPVVATPATSDPPPLDGTKVDPPASQELPTTAPPSALASPIGKEASFPPLSALTTNGSTPPSALSLAGAPTTGSPVSVASLPLPPASTTASIAGLGEEDRKASLPGAAAAAAAAAAASTLPLNPMASGTPGGAEHRLPSSLADLVSSYEVAKQKSLRRDGTDLSSIHNILDSGYSNIPQPLDAEKPKYYVPRNPYATPAYYPQEPSSQFANPGVFAKFDVDTLFYIFYYCQGTYLQYLAASELKKQSWRFHKQYLTWFQRANEPQQITDDYEQGVYLYFDWEGSWCQRRKSSFKFEYRFLETE